MKQMLVVAAMIGLGLVASVRTAPRIITVQYVYLTVGPAWYFTPWLTGWRFPVQLAAGEDLILTGSRPGNFATGNVSGPYPVNLYVMVDGVMTHFEDVSGVLTLRGHGSDAAGQGNRAQEFGSGLGGPGYIVDVGYADTVHFGTTEAPQSCGQYADSLGLLGAHNCTPAGFDHPVYFQGSPSLQNGRVGYDAGVIRIVATE